MQSPLISLITVVRNGADTIERALASVQAQTFRNFEYIVLDAASTDGTQSIIERFRPIVTHYASRQDKGATYAFNEAVGLAKGQLIGLLSADDWLEPEALSVIADTFSGAPEAGMVCFGLVEHWPNGERRLFRDPPSPLFGVIDGLYCHGLTRFYHRSLFDRFGYFDADRWPRLADRDYYIRLGLAGVRKAWTDKVIYHFVSHEGSLTANHNPRKIASLLEETLHIAESHIENTAIAEDQRAACKRWYAFTLIRLLYFQLRTGQMRSAVEYALRGCIKFPRECLWAPFRYRIPMEYRARSVP